jgi:hypothetical protein
MDIAKNILEFSLKNYGEDHEKTSDLYYVMGSNLRNLRIFD